MKKESILLKKIIILICTFALLFLLMGCDGIVPGANSDSQLNAVVKLIDVPVNMWWQDVNWWQSKDLDPAQTSWEYSAWTEQLQAVDQSNYAEVNNGDSSSNNTTTIEQTNNNTQISVTDITDNSTTNNSTSINLNMPVWHSEYDKFVYVYYNIKNTGKTNIDEFTIGFTAYAVPTSQGTPKSSNVLTYTGLSKGVNLAVGESRDFFAQINVANDKVVWMELTHFDLK